MSRALKQLRRRPRSFLLLAGAQTVLVILALFLEGLIGGIYTETAGALQVQRADLVTFSTYAAGDPLASRVTPTILAHIRRVPGVHSVSGLGAVLTGAELPAGQTASVAMIGYQAANQAVPAPPPPGEAYADRSLTTHGVKIGQRLLVGPNQTPVRVIGWVSHTSLLLQGALWVATPTWRSVLRAADPAAALTRGEFQIALITTSPGASPATVATRIDQANGGRTRTLTRAQATGELPGLSAMRATFDGVIGATLLIAALITALFFAIAVAERRQILAVLSAIGLPSWTLGAELVIQAALVTFAAFVLAAILAGGMALASPPGLPFALAPSSIIAVGLLAVITAALGTVAAARRATRIEPALALSDPAPM